MLEVDLVLLLLHAEHGCATRRVASDLQDVGVCEALFGEIIWIGCRAEAGDLFHEVELIRGALFHDVDGTNVRVRRLLDKLEVFWVDLEASVFVFLVFGVFLLAH